MGANTLHFQGVGSENIGIYSKVGSYKVDYEEKFDNQPELPTIMLGIIENVH